MIDYDLVTRRMWDILEDEERTSKEQFDEIARLVDANR
jgi:hypothetical protein